MNKNNKFVVIRTHFTNSDKLTWMNGLLCVWKGNLNQLPVNLKVLVMNGYEGINSLFQTILGSDSISFGASLLKIF